MYTHTPTHMYVCVEYKSTFHLSCCVFRICHFSNDKHVLTQNYRFCKKRIFTLCTLLLIVIPTNSTKSICNIQRSVSSFEKYETERFRISRKILKKYFLVLPDGS